MNSCIVLTQNWNSLKSNQAVDLVLPREKGSSPCFALIGGVPCRVVGLLAVWRILAHRGGGGDVVGCCSPEKSHFPTSDPTAVARAAPWPSGADGQLRGYLYRFSNSCQGGGKDYSATSSELLAEPEHKPPIKGFIQ